MTIEAGAIHFSVDIETDKTLRAQDKIDQGFDKLQKGMDDTDKSAKQLGGGLTKLASALAAVATASAVANEFQKAIAVTREFNATISNLSALTGAVGEDLAAFRQAAIDIGGSTSLSATQAATAMKLIGGASPELLKSADALKAVTQEAVVLAEAAGVDLPTAATALTATLNQFQLGADQASRVINVLAAGAKAGSSEIVDTVQVLQNAGVVAAQAGLSFEQFNGATQALAAGQIKGAEAGTALRNVLTILNTQGVANLRPSVVGLSEALENLEKAGLSDVQMVKLFGRENITAAKVLLQFRDTADEVTKAVTGTSEAYRQASVNQDNLKGDVAELSSAYETLQITIGDLSDGALRNLTQQITEFLTALTANQGVITGFFDAGVLAAEAMALVITGKLVTALALKSKALYDGVIVSQRAAQADLAAAQAATQLAAQELILAAEAERASVGLSSHAAAAARLTAAQTTATATTTALSAAQQRVAATATVAATAMGGLRTVMGFLGGPVGVALLAAGALYSFATSATEAKPPVDLLSASINELGDAALRLQKIQITEKIEELKGLGATAATSGASVEYLKSQLAQFPNSAKADEWRQRLAEQEAAAEGAGSELETYKKRLEDIGKELDRRSSGAPASPASTEPALTPGTDAPVTGAKGKTEAERAADSIREQVAALELQADTLGMTASELEIYRLQLAGATDEQIRAAQSSLSMIDAFEQQAEAEKKIQQQREAFGKTPADVAAKITGNVDPLSGGMFDSQSARYDAEAEAERVRYEEQLARLNEAKALELQTLTSYQELEAQLAQTHADRMAQIDMAKNQAMLASGQQLFEGLAGATAAFAGEQSGAYKALFAVSKAFALADAAIKIQQGIAAAASLGWPAMIPALASVAATTAGVISSISGTNFSGRAMGGPVQANQMYRVNEGGQPEIFNAANGQQYMMPNQRGEVVSNKDAQGGGEPTVIVNIQNNASGSTATATSRKQDQQTIIDVVVSDVMQNGRIAQAVNRTTGTRRAGG